MFNLAALGAGIGQFAQQQQQERENQVRTLMLQMQLRKFQQEQEQLGREQQAASGLWAAGLGGGLDLGQPAPIRGLPQTAPAPQGGRPSAASAPGMGGGMRAGGALTAKFDPNDPVEFIPPFESGNRNIMQGVVGPNGGYNPSVGSVTGPSSAGGYWQITDPTWADFAPKAGVDLAKYPTAISAPRPVQKAVANAIYRETGFSRWAPYNKRLAAALQGLDLGSTSAGADLAAGSGQFEVPQDMAAGLGGPRPTGPPDTLMASPGQVAAQPQLASVGSGPLVTDPYDPKFGFRRDAGQAAAPPAASQTGGTQAAQADPMQVVDQQATAGVQSAAKGIDSSVMGRLSTQEMMRRIDKAMPNADPLTKFRALEKAQKMLAPDQQVQFQMWKMQHQEELRAALAKFQQDQINLRTEDRAKQQEKMYEQRLQDAPGTIMQTDRGPVRIRPGSNVGEPIDLGGAKVISAGAISKPDLLEIKKEDGTTERVEAQQIRETGQWVTADERRTPIDVSQGYTVLPKGGSGGRQGEQQAARITSAANLLSFELGNMMGLPAMSTASIFQGVESTPGRHLGESLKRTFAAKLTPETATDLATSYQGISRAVAALESGGAATGLVGLTKASEVYMPQPTDTVGNVWRKFATLRGVLERSLQAAASAKDVTPERKKLYEQIKAEVAANIPWTVEEVTKLTSGNVQTYKQLFEKTQHRIEQKAEGKAAGAAAAPAAAGPPPEAIQMLRQDASPARRQQFDSVFGPGAADRVLGSPAVPPAAGLEFTAPIPPPQ